MSLVRQYVEENQQKKSYEPGDRICYAGRVYDENEVCNLVDSALDFWLTAGRYAERFEQQLARFLGVQYASLVNSGSSANLLAFSALTSHELGERRIERGDEIITVAAGFPTTVTPAVQFGAVPVFVDVTIPQYNIDVTLLENALSRKTKAVMLAHTLGNPFDLEVVKSFCDKHRLWLIEDNCDALGSTYTLGGDARLTGTVGDIGTSSFYPPHHITMGEGGCVYTNNPLLHRLVNSYRDWGRDCSCVPGQDGHCGHRFDRQYGSLPTGFDHKYVYSHFGYNLKATDMQAAVGCAQLEKLPDFIRCRRENWAFLRQAMEPFKDFLILPEPAPNTEPSWFGFMMTVRPDSPVSRNELVAHMESCGIQTRPLFAGNLTRHPCFQNLHEGTDYRIAGSLKNTDIIMEHSFWVGVYPGMERVMLEEIARRIGEKLLL